MLSSLSCAGMRNSVSSVRTRYRWAHNGLAQRGPSCSADPAPGPVLNGRPRDPPGQGCYALPVHGEDMAKTSRWGTCSGSAELPGTCGRKQTPDLPVSASRGGACVVWCGPKAHPTEGLHQALAHPHVSGGCTVALLQPAGRRMSRNHPTNESVQVAIVGSVWGFGDKLDGTVIDCIQFVE